MPFQAGRPGTRAEARRPPSARRTLVALLVLTGATFAAGWAQKLPCRTEGYGPANHIAYTRMCYSDVHVAWTSERLDEGKLPYRDHPVEYPVLMGALMALAAVGAHSAAQFFDHTSLLLLVAALAVTATTAKLVGPDRARDAAMVAVAPGMILHGTVNWDLAAAALAGAALLAWARRRPGLAGVALGVGGAVKLYPLLLLLPLLVLCLRRRQVRAWGQAFVAAAATWIACNGLVFAMAGSFSWAENQPARNAVLRFFLFNRDRPADWDSVWFVTQEVMKRVTGDAGWAFSVPTVNLLSALSLILGMAALALLLWRSPSVPQVGQAVFLAVAVFLLTGKVFSPQFTIWLIPLAVMARVRWLPFLGWQALEVGLTITRFLYFDRLAGSGGGLPAGVFTAAVVARDLALLALMAEVVRDIRQPIGDGAGSQDDPDPAAGVLASTAAAP